MSEYHKIQTMFKREKEKPCRIIYGVWTLEEFEYLKDNIWEFTEKVDGTNIRIMFDGEKIKYGGKTDNAQTPCDLVDKLHQIFDPKLELFKSIFSKNGELPISVCLYGEGYGAGIQKGGVYKNYKDFVLFDIKINNTWLKREDVEKISISIGCDIVPVVGRGTLQQGIDMVKKGLKSAWGDFIAEGIVARPITEIKDRRGNRIITKIKYRDFCEGKGENK